MDRYLRSAALTAAIMLAAGFVDAFAQSGSASSTGIPAEAGNFGFPFGFSVEKMDPTADPRKDFRRYAAGRWMDAAVIPSDTFRISGIDVLIKRVEAQIQSVLDDATRASATAAKADASVNYCALGAVIGHEFTHGFDSQGAPLRREGQRPRLVDCR